MLSSLPRGVPLAISSSSNCAYREGEHSVDASLLRLFLSLWIKLVLVVEFYRVGCYDAEVGASAP
jgi:hypothetical protein